MNPHPTCSLQTCGRHLIEIETESWSYGKAAVVQFRLASLWLVLVVCVDKVLKVYWSSAMLLPLL